MFVVVDAHGIEDRLDDAHAVALGLRGMHADSFSSRPTIMQIGSAYSTATPRMALIEVEQAGLLDQQQRALAGVREARADADALVLLADADQPRSGSRGERPQQALAGGDVGHRDDELDAARLDRG